MEQIISNLSNSYNNQIFNFHFDLSNSHLNEANFSPIRMLMTTFSSEIVGLDISNNQLIMNESINKLADLPLHKLQFLNLEKTGLSSSSILSKTLWKLFSPSISNIEILVLNNLSCFTDKVLLDFISSLPQKEVV